MPFNAAYMLPWAHPRARVEEPRAADATPRPRVSPDAVAAVAIVVLPLAWAGLIALA